MHTRTRWVIITLLFGLGFAALAVTFGNTLASQAGWSTPVNATKTLGTSYIPQLAVYQDTTHLVWQDWVDLDPHWPFILYTNKTAGGDWAPFSYLPIHAQGSDPAIDIGPDGTLHIVWSMNGVEYITRAPDGTWSAQVRIDDGEFLGEFPDVAAAPDGTIHVAWASWSGPGTPTNIYHKSKPPGGTWSLTTMVSTLGGRYQYPWIETDSANNAHLIWTDTDTNEFQNAIKPNGDDWSDPVVLPQDPLPWTSNTSLASDPYGGVHLIWIEWDSRAGSACRVQYAKRVLTGPWSGAQTLSSICADSSAISVDAQGRAHAVWHNDKKIGYRAQDDSGNWGSTSTMDMEDYWLIMDSSIAIAAGSQGDTHIAWDSGPVYTETPHDGRGEIYYTGKGKWSPATEVISPAGGTLISPSGVVTANFPAGSVTTDTLVTYTPITESLTASSVGMRYFDLSAERASDGTPVTSFDPPYTLIVSYADLDLGVASEDTLALFYWDGSQWTGESTSTLDMEAKQVTATPNHMTKFALFAEVKIISWKVYLPLLSR
jgi:hypothetical protein